MRYKKNLKIEGNKVYSYNKHVATIYQKNRILYGYWSVNTSKHVNYIAREYNLNIVKGLNDDVNREKEKNYADELKSIGMVAMFGNVLCNDIKEKNTWKKRMMLAGSNGISFPDNWDTLSEEEKQSRLNNAIASTF